MAGLTQLLDIAASGLSAATAGAETVSNNTANVNTPGYNTEAVSQTALAQSGDSVGRGTQVTAIGRAFDPFAFQQVVASSSAAQASQVLQQNSAALAALFPVASGGSGGLGAAFSSFFAAANTLAGAPASTPDREALLGEAQSLAGTFHSLAGAVADHLAGLGGQLGDAVQQINSLSQQIAALNQSIAAAGSGASPNALLDQRDQLVQQLSQQLGVTVLSGANGALEVYTTSGAALVNGVDAFQLSVTAGPYDDGTAAILYGPTGQDLTDGLSGGALGGLVASRAQLTDARNAVGALAAGLAAAVNTQQSLGLDQNGALGQSLFSLAGPNVYAAAANLGSGTLSAAITDPAQFVPGDFILTKTASGFEATETDTGQTTALGSGPTLSLDGITITVSGSIATGDSFKLEPTATAAQTLAVATTDPAAIAAASAYVVTPGAADGSGAVTDTNRGTVTATVGGPAASGTLPPGTVSVPASAFGQSLTIAFTSAADFQVKTSAGTVLASGAVSPTAGAEIAIAYPAPPAPSGEVETVSLSPGTAAAGDSFTLSSGGVGSNGNIAALAGLATAPLVSGQRIGDAYAALVSTVGSNGQNAQIAATAAQGVLTRAQQTQQSISGVNLDEEAAHLVAYQEAYQAAAHVIATAQTLFQSLLGAVQAG
ncbi:MAG TPA: flagellar hook-associated protein FlgK [Stellaceae bacterium]|nr:flagellar hook-associated protein FlgK [Stellaceae bacterium]